MSNESKVTRSVNISGGGVTVGGVTETILVDNVATFSKIIPAGSVNIQLVRPDVTIANCKAMAIGANKACSVCTNAASTGSPQDEIDLVANKPLSWLTGDPTANKFLAGNVTDWYVTCTDDTFLKIIIGEDSTPGVSD